MMILTQPRARIQRPTQPCPMYADGGRPAQPPGRSVSSNPSNPSEEPMNFPEASDGVIRDCAEILGVDALDPRVRRTISRLIHETRSHIRARRYALDGQTRKRYHRSVENTAKKLRRLLEDAHPSAAGELTREGVYFAVNLPPEEWPVDAHINLEEIASRIEWIEQAARKAGSNQGKRGARNTDNARKAAAQSILYEFLGYCPEGTQEQATEFAERVWEAAIREEMPSGDGGEAEKPMGNYVSMYWSSMKELHKK